GVVPGFSVASEARHLQVGRSVPGQLPAFLSGSRKALVAGFGPVEPQSVFAAPPAVHESAAAFRIRLLVSPAVPSSILRIAGDPAAGLPAPCPAGPIVCC